MRRMLLISASILLFVLTLPLVFFWAYGKVHPLPDQAILSQLEELRQTHLVNTDSGFAINNADEFASSLAKIYTNAPTERFLLAIFDLYAQNDQLKNLPVIQETACHVSNQYSQDKLFLFVSRLEEMMPFNYVSKTVEQLIPECSTKGGLS